MLALREYSHCSKYFKREFTMRKMLILDDFEHLKVACPTLLSFHVIPLRKLFSKLHGSAGETREQILNVMIFFCKRFTKIFFIKEFLLLLRLHTF